MIVHPRKLDMLENLKLFRDHAYILATIVRDQPEIPGMKEGLDDILKIIKDYEVKIKAL